MRNKVAKQLRKQSRDSAPLMSYPNADIKVDYEDKTYHHVYTGKDIKGDKTFMEVINPIKIIGSERLRYKRLKNDYKTNNKG